MLLEYLNEGFKTPENRKAYFARRTSSISRSLPLLAQGIKDGFKLSIRKGGAVPYVSSNGEKIRRAGTMFIKNLSTGLEIPAGYWMDWPEKKDNVKTYNSKSENHRASMEIENQLRYGLKDMWKHHYGIATTGKSGFSSR